MRCINKLYLWFPEQDKSLKVWSIPDTPDTVKVSEYVSFYSLPNGYVALISKEYFQIRYTELFGHPLRNWSKSNDTEPRNEKSTLTQESSIDVAYGVTRPQWFKPLTISVEYLKL